MQTTTGLQQYTVGTGDRDVEEKEVEVSIVAESDAVSDPRTMVVHFQNTPKSREMSIDSIVSLEPVANTAVMCEIWFGSIAYFTVSPTPTSVNFVQNLSSNAPSEIP